jgi:hypothetical protein
MHKHIELIIHTMYFRGKIVKILFLYVYIYDKCSVLPPVVGRRAHVIVTLFVCLGGWLMS